MKLKNILSYLAIMVFITTQLCAQNTHPVVTNVAFTSSGTTVTVTYDVYDAEQSTVTISMEVSSDAGATWDFDYGTAGGAIGTGVPIGTGKIITWTYSGGYSELFKIRIIADDVVGDQIYYASKIYNTVTIGSQIWLKENLNVGTRIDGTQNSMNNGVIEKYCYWDNPDICAQFGGLYEWNETMQYVNTQGAKGICPNGWHIPSYTELQSLKTAVNDDGDALKEIMPGIIATNTSGFSALLAGIRSYYDGGFYYRYTKGYFWSSTEYDATRARVMALYYNYNAIDLGYGTKDYMLGEGLSVRCIKN